MSEIEKTYININNSRSDDQRGIMQDILETGECPFCEEGLSKYHKQDILRKGAHWILTHNQWPYEDTDLHLLAISTYHAENISDLEEGSFDELQEHVSWAEREFNIRMGAIAMRFGDVSLGGASVQHLHAHIIVPSIDKPSDKKVRFKIG